MQCPGKNFTGTGRSLIDQHHKGLVGDRAASRTPDIANSFTSAGADDGALVQPLPCNVDAGLKQSARVAAQIKHIALSSLRLQILDGLSHLTRCVCIELLKPDVAHLATVRGRVERGLHGMNLDARPFQRHIQNLTLAPESQHHIGPLWATDQLDSVFGGHALRGGTVNRNDDILGLNPGTGCRRSLNWRDND